jgi:hypothetical protein
MKRATPAPEHVSARVEAIVAASTREEATRETPVRTVSGTRPAIVPHPNGVWGNARAAVVRAAQPWPPAKVDPEQNGAGNGSHPASNGIEAHVPDVVEDLASEDWAPTQTALEPLVAEPEPPEEIETSDDAFEMISAPAEEPSVIDEDPEWAVAPAPAVVQAAPLEPLLMTDVTPVRETVQAAREDGMDQGGQAELVLQLLKRVEELERKLDQRRWTRFWRRLAELFVMHDPA